MKFGRLADELQNQNTPTLTDELNPVTLMPPCLGSNVWETWFRPRPAIYWTLANRCFTSINEVEVRSHRTREQCTPPHEKPLVRATSLPMPWKKTMLIKYNWVFSVPVTTCQCPLVSGYGLKIESGLTPAFFPILVGAAAIVFCSLLIVQAAARPSRDRTAESEAQLHPCLGGGRAILLLHRGIQPLGFSSSAFCFALILFFSAFENWSKSHHISGNRRGRLCMFRNCSRVRPPDPVG